MRTYIHFMAVCLIAVCAYLYQSQPTWAQHGHGWGHGGHGHGGYGHVGHGGYGHVGHGGYLHGGHGGYWHGGSGHLNIHVGRSYLVPFYNHHYHGAYWVDSGLYYYQASSVGPDHSTYVVARPIEIEFGGYAHLEDLAARLSLLANDLCLDMHYNYNNNPGFSDTYSEAYHILELAKSLQGAEQENNRAEIVDRVQELDDLLHYVQNEVRSWTRHHHHQIGESGILSKVEILESLVHHLMHDIGVVPHNESVEQAPPPATNEVAPPPLAFESTIITSPPPSLP